MSVVGCVEAVGTWKGASDRAKETASRWATSGHLRLSRLRRPREEGIAQRGRVEEDEAMKERQKTVKTNGSDIAVSG